MSQAFKEISERAWHGAMKWAEAECNRIGMKAGALEFRDIFSQNVEVSHRGRGKDHA